ncbi:M1 family metallopeptidase [Geothrix sp. PMB-07]|uniref:M1 family metallopeptidase n=1 Tax=Geothrix sp. PMB-07 TaxID=3068640 RepID=UPI002741B954|nr:M1 family metallopeptidase [Geothrix sp. PMB-07]WLT32823.1 M1 family metallopeptidase [Geothrix sp. PMB-07]
MHRPDPHSYYDAAQPKARRLRLRLGVDFKAKRIDGEVVLEFGSAFAGPIDLDTKGLEILSVQVPGQGPVAWELGSVDAILGQRLSIQAREGTQEVAITYRTGPDAMALQWLDPEQTEGKVAPYLFSQCQQIHARTMVPCQDTPVARIAYQAEVIVPEGLTAVMSAGPAGDEALPDGRHLYRFNMPQPIPSYLMALAVGRLESRDLSPRARVWAEPETVAAAAWEFAGVEDMILKAEGLFGAYPWDRYDMLVLPPSFPYGGMENPRMTFLTPTLLAGDRSLVDVVAHELAHSWTGNLVTNASMEHFWLNEGFTVWAERRILRILHGDDAAALGWAMGQKALEDSLARFKNEPHLTVLRLHLEGIDPDDAFSSIPYEKGARLVAALEKEVGEDRFLRFIREYMDAFRFTSITTEQWCAFVDAKLPGALKAVNASAYLDKPGLPETAPEFHSVQLDTLTVLAESWTDGGRPSAHQIASWKPAELQVYLQKLPRQLTQADCAWLDEHFKLMGRGNHEILVEWLTLAAAAEYEPAFPRIREVLMRVGRMKYLRPLYGALGQHARTRALAREIFAAASPGYHGLSRRVVQSVLEAYPA